MNGGGIIGASYPIRDAYLKATGRLRYCPDIEVPGVLHAALLLSPHAHARITHIDTSEAERMEGVRCVVSHKNVPRIPFNSAKRFTEHSVPENEYIFDTVVRYVGDRVAAVAAETVDIARQAAKKIHVEYEELPAVFDIQSALADDAPAIHEGGNRVHEFALDAGNVDEGFQQAHYIFEDTYTTPAIHHAALENHCFIADFSADGKLTVWSTAQNVFAVRLVLSNLFSMPMHKIRVIKPPQGGSFGGKLSLVHEPVVASLSMKTGRPVRLHLSRRETFISTRTRHAARVRLKTGVTAEGRIVAQDIELYTNTGAYCSAALNVVGAVSHKAFKLYRTPHVRFRGYPVYTNLPVAGAMRGYGSPQFFFAQQVQLNSIARQLHLDPVEMQRINLVQPDAVEPLHGSSLGNPRPIDCLLKGAEMFDWARRRDESGGDDADVVRGVGMAVGLHGNGVYGAHRDFIGLSLKLNEDATGILYTGTHDMGNGAVTVQTQIIAHELGMSPWDIECVESDTETVLWNLGDFASRGVYVCGEAARLLALKMKRLLAEEAARILGTRPEQLLFRDGHVVSNDSFQAELSLGQIVRSIHETQQSEVMVYESYASKAARVSYGVHYAQVEVNTSTAEVRVTDYVAVHDVGKVINQMLIEGQLEGAIQMGIGYAIAEGLEFDEKGKLQNNTFKKYKLLRAGEMPSMRLAFVEEEDFPGPYGAKSIGESSTVPAAPAVVNAVNNALGIDAHEIPLKPSVLKRYLSTIQNA
jgi:CO/xanthine dehydrogenase Mo-binding subunit